MSQAGDAFSASNMNDLEDRIDEAFKEVNANFQGATNSVREALVAVGLEIPKNLTIQEMMRYAEGNLFVKTEQSSISLTGSNSAWLYAGAIKLHLSRQSISGSAFSASDGGVIVNYPVKAGISCNISTYNGEKGTASYAQIRVNGTVKGQGGSTTANSQVSLNPSAVLDLEAGDYIELYVNVASGRILSPAGTMSITGTKI